MLKDEHPSRGGGGGLGVEVCRGSLFRHVPAWSFTQWGAEVRGTASCSDSCAAYRPAEAGSSRQAHNHSSDALLTWQRSDLPLLSYPDLLLCSSPAPSLLAPAAPGLASCRRPHKKQTPLIALLKSTGLTLALLSPPSQRPEQEPWEVPGGGREGRRQQYRPGSPPTPPLVLLLPSLPRRHSQQHLQVGGPGLVH